MTVLVLGGPTRAPSPPPSLATTLPPQSGTVDIIKDGDKVASKGPGDVFGELALLKEDKRAATVTASSKVKLLALGREDFVAMLGNVSGACQGRPTAIA